MLVGATSRGTAVVVPWAISLLLAGWLCTFVHSCSPAVDPQYRQLVQEPVLVSVPVDELAATDRFEVRVAGEEALSGEFTVPSSGAIAYPWTGDVEVAGRTCSQIAGEILVRLNDGYLLDASVTCQILEINSRRIDVIGEVNRPGSFPYEDNMTVLRAIARAEGFSDDASPNATSVLRIVSGGETRVRIPLDDIIAGLEPNFSLLPGDTVVVPRFVFIP